MNEWVSEKRQERARIYPFLKISSLPKIVCLGETEREGLINDVDDDVYKVDLNKYGSEYIPDKLLQNLDRDQSFTASDVCCAAVWWREQVAESYKWFLQSPFEASTQ